MNKILTIIFAFIGITTFAQAPEGINYQAVIRDNTGTVIASTSVGISITIYQTSPTGTLVYEETFAPTTNGFGLVNLVIGQGTVVSGTFSTIDWGNGPYYAEISADAGGGTTYTLLGTQQLMSVPYALYAKEAENAFSGDYNDLTNQPSIPTNTSDLINDSGFITSPDDADADPTNEIQALSISEDTISLSSGGFVVQAAPVVESTGGRSEMCSGNTAAGTGWNVYDPSTIYLSVNTSGCGFSSTPRYFTSVGGLGSHFELVGASAIYSPTSTGFSVYVQKNDGTPLTPVDAANGGWFINWTAVGQ
jgi:hypothetical protein